MLEIYHFLGNGKPRLNQDACSVVLEMDWGDGDVEGCCIHQAQASLTNLE